jgi:subtilase family serine protease
MSRPLILVPIGVLAVLILLYTLGSSAQSPSRDRLSQAIDNNQRLMVPGNVSPLARPEFDRGRVEGSMLLNHVALSFRLSPDQQHELDQLLAQQQDPTSVNYHKWITPEQYADRFGLSANDLARVTAWLQAQGLAVEGVSRDRTEVYFSATAAQIGAVFNTEIHRYQLRGENHFANAAPPAVPAALGHLLLGIRNLNDFRPKPRSRRISPHFTSAGSHFLAPDDFATIYDLKPLYSSGLDGTGQKIAVVGDSAITITDIDAFRKAAGLGAANLTQVAVGGTAPHNSDEAEADLDLEWAGAVARAAQIIYVVAGPNASGGAFDALHDAITNNRAPVISNSFGLCEADIGQPMASTVRGWIQQANSHGQTVTSASGDTGAADCDGDSSTAPSSAMKGLSVDVPAAIPEVTGVGGSEFNEGSGNFWSSTNNANNGSALSYIPEKAWNDTGIGARTTLAASGGGKSIFFLKTDAPYQQGVTPADGARDVPDVSLSASPDHDGYLVCTQGSCANGFSTSTVFGGTSVSSPTFAGILAIANQSAASGGLGNVNTKLYGLAGTSSFHDIATGDNIVPCQPGTPTSAPWASIDPKCPSSGKFGYPAGSGYDLVTGLGSVDANILVSALGGGGGGGGGNGAQFVLSSNPTSIAITNPGGNGSSTITVTPLNGFTGSVALSCALVPASSTAKISCTIPSPVTVSGNTPTALLTVLTTGSTASLRLGHGIGWWAVSGGLFACIFIAGFSSRRRRSMLISGLLLMASLALAAGCGGGSSTPVAKANGTPPGNYTITITATSGSSTTTKNVPVTVQ